MNREEAITALGDRNNLLWGMSQEEKKYYSEALDMAISALSAEGEYIKKEDVIKVVQKYAVDEQDGSEEWRSRVNDYLCSVYQDVSDLPTYSFPDREKGEQLYSDLLRVKHGTMNIDSLIDKVYADMRGKSDK